MEILIPFLIFIGFAAAASTWGSNDWKEVAEELGLEYSNFLDRNLSGTIDGYKVSIEKAKHHIAVRVRGKPGHRNVLNSISLDRQGFLSGILGGEDIEIGCPTFDANTYISSNRGNSAAEVSALLDDQTRRIVSKYVVNNGAKVTHGEIIYTGTNSIRRVPVVLNGLLRLARQLSVEYSEIPTRLAANALEDPVSSVRLRNLTLLQEHYSRRNESITTSKALLKDPNNSIRLAAAMFVEDEGLPVVKEVAQSKAATIDIRLKAIKHLARNSRREDLVDISQGLLKERDPQLQRLGIRPLGRMKHTESLDLIIPLLKTRNLATLLEAIKAVENIGDSSAESALANLLKHPNNRVKTAAIEALATVGTVTAVEPLHELTSRLGFKRSARVAIDSIQSRLGDVESGRLSLAPAIDPAGALSLIADPEMEGGLSLDDPDQ